MITPIEITREHANEIIAEHMKLQHQRVVICYRSRWYDIRGMSDAQVSEFTEKLLNEK
jgi:uncharacterized protein YcfL